MRPLLAAILASACLAGCAASAPAAGTEWSAHDAVLQAFVGVTSFERVAVEDVSVDGDEGDLDALPVLGVGAQWKLGGERADLGLEGSISFSSCSESQAFVGSGGGAVAIDVDLLLVDLYGGPFASVFLGERLRVYGAAGPLVEFAEYDQTGAGLADDGSGTGLGFYARTGVELVLASRTMIGLAARWSDTTVDLGGALGELEIDGLQALLTLSSGM